MTVVMFIEELKKEKKNISRHRDYSITGNEYMNILDSMINALNENIELKKELKETKAIKQEVIIKEKIIYRKR